MSIQNISVISELAGVLYDFLPGSAKPYGNQAVTFPGCAHRVGVGSFWPGGSKRPAITTLLQATLERNSGKFCPLLLSIVETAIVYRNQKENPISREEILNVNRLVKELGFKIPELWDPAFLDRLPRKKISTEPVGKQPDFAALKKQYLELADLPPHERGYAFQRFLIDLFGVHGLAPRAPFRLNGEEIDGSLELDGDTYLLEAKWHKERTGQADLLTFKGKIDARATWSRGLFISYLGFTMEGLEAFARGRATNIIGMDGLDILFVVEGKVGLKQLIQAKARRAVEGNEFFVPVMHLL